jgi:hypothetical protein
MTNTRLQDRPHLATLARRLQTVLELADELYQRGRGSGESVDYSEFEERAAHATAEVERGVHHVALSGLDVDAPRATRSTAAPPRLDSATHSELI